MPTVKLFANLRKIAGTRELQVPGSSLSLLFANLAAQQPALAAVLLNDGHLRPHVIITINGHPTLEVDTSLTEQDQIAIFPPIAGG